MEDVEQTFTSFTILVPELRKHALTYFDKASLFNYAQCAEFCSKDVKSYNRFAPRCIQIKDLEDGKKGIEVVFHFKKIVRTMRFTDVGNNMFCFTEIDQDGNQSVPNVLDGNPVNNAFDFIDQELKRLNQGVVEGFEINLKQWRKRVMNLRIIPQVQTFVVTVSKSNYRAFIDDMNQRGDISADFVILRKAGNVKFEMPRTYQRSAFVNQPGRTILTFPYTEFNQTNADGGPNDDQFYGDHMNQAVIINALHTWLQRNGDPDITVFVPATNPLIFERELILRSVASNMIELNGKSFLTRKDGSRLEVFISEKRAILRRVLEK